MKKSDITAGIWTRINNRINSIKDNLSEQKKKKEKAMSELPKLKAEMGEFKFEAKLKALKTKSMELETKIRKDSVKDMG